MSSKVQNLRSTSPGLSRFWRVRCEMGHIPLNAGTYHVHAYMGDGLIDVARFTRAFAIRVAENDVFGWGNSLPSRSAWGAMYWAPDWKIASVEEPPLEIHEVVQS